MTSDVPSPNPTERRFVFPAAYQNASLQKVLAAVERASEAPGWMSFALPALLATVVVAVAVAFAAPAVVLGVVGVLGAIEAFIQVRDAYARKFAKEFIGGLEYVKGDASWLRAAARWFDLLSPRDEADGLLVKAAGELGVLAAEWSEAESEWRRIGELIVQSPPSNAAELETVSAARAKMVAVKAKAENLNRTAWKTMTEAVSAAEAIRRGTRLRELSEDALDAYVEGFTVPESAGGQVFPASKANGRLA